MRRIRGALRPLLKAAPLSKSAVLRIVATLKTGLAVWQTRALADLEVVYLYLDAIALRVRSAGKVVSQPILGAVAVLADGQKQLLTLELCSGESGDAWKGCLDDLVARGLKAPVLCIVDGNAGLRRPRAPVADDRRPAVLRAQTAERGAQGASECAGRDPGRLPPDRLCRRRGSRPDCRPRL
jgi:transposase-like protein